MASQLVVSNVVIAARQFNPSVMSQLWLVRNELMRDEDFQPGCVFSDSLVQVRSNRFTLLVVPEQFQFVPQTEADQEQALLQEKIGAIVNRLPHTPFVAMGLNFLWHVTPDEGNIERLSRHLFYRAESPLYQEFDSSDAKFGGYLSKDELGCRLKLDIKPIIVSDTQQEFMNFAFNYHLDLAGTADAVPRIEVMLGRWEEAKANSMRIIQVALAGE